MSGSFGFYQQHSNSSDILKNLFTRVYVEPLSREELERVTLTRYPQFSTIVDRLLDIYFLLSSGKHAPVADVDDDVVSDVGKFVAHEGRQISTRFQFLVPVSLPI